VCKYTTTGRRKLCRQIKDGKTNSHDFLYDITTAFVNVGAHSNLSYQQSSRTVLAFRTQVLGFKPGRNRRIFRAKKSSARLLSEGKYNHLPHVVLYGM
jgi:hypothetical protein